MEIAMVRGYYLSSRDPAELDKMIDKSVSSAVKPDVTLESIAAFGGGKQAYLDIDMIGYMKLLFLCDAK